MSDAPIRPGDPGYPETLPTPVPEVLQPQSPTTPIVGRMVVEFHDNGTSQPHPVVSFDPVGRITPGLIDHFLPLFCSRVLQAQAAVRHAARAPEPTTTSARRRSV